MACWDCCVSWVGMQEEKEARMLAGINMLEQELGAERELVAETKKTLLTAQVLSCLSNFVLSLGSDLVVSLYRTCKCVVSLALWCAFVRQLVCICKLPSLGCLLCIFPDKQGVLAHFNMLEQELGVEHELVAETQKTLLTAQVLRLLSVCHQLLLSTKLKHVGMLSESRVLS